MNSQPSLDDDSLYVIFERWPIGGSKSTAKEVRDFIGGLKNDRDFDEAGALIKLLAERGNLLREPRSKALGEGLFELRGKQVRIFYVFRAGRRIVLLDGLVKKRSQIPKGTLDALRALAKVVK